MRDDTLRAVIEKQVDKVTKAMRYVWCEDHADSFFSKLKKELIKKAYILLIEQEDLHIFMVDTKTSKHEVIGEVVYDIAHLYDITVQTLWSQKQSAGKALSFSAPDGTGYQFMIPHDARMFEHKDQEKHLKDIVDILMPSN